MKIRLIVLLILFLIFSSAFFLDRSLDKGEYSNLPIPSAPDDLIFKEANISPYSDTDRKKIDEIDINEIDEIIYQGFSSIYLKRFEVFDEAQKEALFFIDKGFKAYLKPSEGEEFYDLLIGPYVNKSDLSKDQESIRKLTQEKSSIVDYSY